MRGLTYLLGKITTFIVIYRKLIPASLAFIILAVGFTTRLFRDGASQAFEYLTLALLAAEYTIKTQIDKLLAGEVSTIVAGIEIFGALVVLVGVVKVFAMILIHFTGSQARWGAYIIGIFLVGILEYTAVAVFSETTGFVPLRDGLLYLLVNIDLFIPDWLASQAQGSLPADSAGLNESTNVTDAV